MMAKKKFFEHLSQHAIDWSQNIGAVSGNTYHGDWPVLDSENLGLWEEFDSRTFKFLYPGLYNFVSDCPSIPRPPKSMTLLTGEDAVEHLLSSTVISGLGKLFESVEEHLERMIWLVSKSFCNLGSDVSHSNLPDWHCAVGKGGSIDRTFDFCPGDTKSGNKFRPNELLNKGYTSAYDNMLPVRQIAHYCRIAKSRYGFILTEREVFVARVSFEVVGIDLTPLARPVLTREAAPAPGSLVNRFSGVSDVSSMSGFSGRMSSISLESFAPEDPSYVEFEAFPWADEKRGLTGLAALAFLLVIATEPEELGTGRRHGSYCDPLHAVVKKTTRKPSSKSRKRFKSTIWISKLNGNQYHKEPPKWVTVEVEDTSKSQGHY